MCTQPFLLFLLNSDVLGSLSCLTSTRQSNRRERGIKGTNTFDRLTQDEPWGHPETAFDTDAYILGSALGNSRYSHKSFATSAKRKTDVFTSRKERKMPKNFATSASEQDYISLLELGCTWPWGSVIKGFWGGKKKSLQWNAQHLMYAHSPFFFTSQKKNCNHKRYKSRDTNKSATSVTIEHICKDS